MNLAGGLVRMCWMALNKTKAEAAVAFRLLCSTSMEVLPSPCFPRPCPALVTPKQNLRSRQVTSGPHLVVNVLPTFTWDD